MKHSLIRWGNTFFDRPWRLLAFQPVLYFFIWGSAIRLTIDQDPPPNFAVTIAPGFYDVWLTLGAICPLIALLSWFLIQKCSGRKRFLGMWFRLSADLGILTTLFTYHIVNVFNDAPSESRIYGRYLQGAILIFTIGLVVRDVWTLVIVERLAGRIHSGEE